MFTNSLFAIIMITVTIYTTGFFYLAVIAQT